MKAGEETHRVENEAAGRRLDVFLAGRLEAVSRSHVQKWLADGQVTVNGKAGKANYKVKAGDCVALIVPPAAATAIEPEAIPLSVLYEDADVIVVNKARGMVVHPAAGNYSATLVNALLAHCRDLSGIHGEIRPGIVHRLDKDTSGVMIAAKNDAAHLDLARQIREHSAKRRYVAIVHGDIRENEGRIDAPIGRHHSDRKKMAVAPGRGKPARTYFRVLERFGGFTLVLCELATGRTHQIRVHMQYIGHPVAGDPKYGPSRPAFAINGQALHSARLQFCHPATRRVLSFTAALPSDMRAILTRLRAKR